MTSKSPKEVATSFLNLGYPEDEAQEHMQASKLLEKIQCRIREIMVSGSGDQKSMISKIAGQLGTTEDSVADLLKGRLSQFSRDQLSAFVFKLRGF